MAWGDGFYKRISSESLEKWEMDAQQWDERDDCEEEDDDE